MKVVLSYIEAKGGYSRSENNNGNASHSESAYKETWFSFTSSAGNDLLDGSGSGSYQGIHRGKSYSSSREGRKC